MDEEKYRKIFGLICKLTECNSDIESLKVKLREAQEDKKHTEEEIRMIILKS